MPDALSNQELETVARVLAEVTGKPVDKCRQILISAMAKPTFQPVDLLLKLPPGEAMVFTMALRQESPQALSWFMGSGWKSEPGR
jgi:hypothetical protein